MTDDSHRIHGADRSAFLAAVEQAVTRAEAVIGPDATPDGPLSHDVDPSQERALLLGFDIEPVDFARFEYGTIGTTLDAISEDLEGRAAGGQLHGTLGELLEAIKPHLHSLIYYALLTGEYHGAQRGRAELLDSLHTIALADGSAADQCDATYQLLERHGRKVP